MKYKTYQHNPPHLMIDNSFYFLTAATYNRIRYFNTGTKKCLLEEQINTIFDKYNWQIEDYVILENHYHVLVKSDIGADMSAIFRDIHRETSNYLKRNGVRKGIKIWWNYWDTVIRNQDEYDFYTYYIWFNPVKHGYVENSSKWRWLKTSIPEDLNNGKYSVVENNHQLLKTIYDKF